MSANRTRVQVRGSIGKSVRFPTGTSGSGATIGVDFALPDGSIPTLQQLAAALATGAAIQDQPGNIIPPGGGPTVIWQNIQYIPPNITYPARQTYDMEDPEAPLIVPGPQGLRGAPGTAITLYPEDPDDPISIPGAAGPVGPTGASGTGAPGAPGVTIPMYPDDAEEALPIPGVAGQPGQTGGPGSPGAPGVTIPMFPDDAEDVWFFPGVPGPQGSQGIQGVPGQGGGGGGAYLVEADLPDDVVPELPSSLGPLAVNGWLTGNGQWVLNAPASAVTTALGVNVFNASTDALALNGVTGTIGPDIALKLSGTAKGFIGVCSKANEGVTGGAAGDMYARVESAGTLWFTSGSTPRMSMTAAGTFGLTPAAGSNGLVISPGNSASVAINIVDPGANATNLRINTNNTQVVLQCNGTSTAFLVQVPGGTAMTIASSTQVTFLNRVGINNVAPPAQVAGWGTPAGPAVVVTFPATPTLAQCGQAIGQIIKDLKAFGLYAA